MTSWRPGRLYVLLKPVNRHVSLLTAWFRLVYTVVALVALADLAFVLRLLKNADYAALLRRDQLHAQIRLSLGAFRNGWSLGLVIFRPHARTVTSAIPKAAVLPVKRLMAWAKRSLWY